MIFNVYPQFISKNQKVAYDMVKTLALLILLPLAIGTSSPYPTVAGLPRCGGPD
jgi:hypothetical protein